MAHDGVTAAALVDDRAETEKEQAKPRFSRDELTLLALIFSASLVVATGIQMGNALFPALSRLLDVPISTVTGLVSVWAFTGLLTPLFGPPSDRYGHGLFLLAGLGTFALGNLLCAVAPSFSALLLFQILVGLGYAVFGFSASAVVGDVFAYETRARAMGIVRFAVSVSALVGVPAVVAIADWATARGAFGAVGGLSLVVLIVASARLLKLSRQATTTRDTAAQINFWQTVLRIIRQPSLMAGLLVVLVWATIPTGMFIYLAAWLEETFRFTETQVGLAFSVVGVGSLIGNTLVATWTDRVGKKRSAVLGLLVMSAMAALLSRSPTVAAALVSLVGFTAALEFGSTSFITLMTELAPDDRGTLMSLVSLTIGVGTGLVPLLMQALWESAGYAAVAAVLGAVGLAAAVFVASFVKRFAV